MDKKMIEKLLQTQNENDFFDIIDVELAEKIAENITLWDKKVVEHCLKLTGMTYEELKKEMYIDELEYYD